MFIYLRVAGAHPDRLTVTESVLRMGVEIILASFSLDNKCKWFNCCSKCHMQGFFNYSITTKKANTISVFVRSSEVFATGAGTDLSRRISVSSLKHSAYKA